MINGARVKQARELCGFTQTRLAEHIGVHQTTITYIESGRMQPSDELISKIAFATKVPLAFLGQGAPIEFPEGSLLYRARTTLPADARTQAYRYGQVGFELMERMAHKLRMASPRLPQIQEADQQQKDVASAAQFTRNALGLSPDTPIPHLIRAAERCGVFVVAVPYAHPKADAFSLWVGGDVRRPVIVTLDETPGDRLRFSVAHELGHLVLHWAQQGSWRVFEKEADAFAGELLLPRIAMEQEIERPVTLTGLAALKRRWGVSLQALIQRAKDIGYVSERQYYYLCEQIRDNHWRMREPIEIPVERPRAFLRMAELLFPTTEGAINFPKLASETKLSVARVKEYMRLQEGMQGAKVTNVTDKATAIR